MLVHQSDDSGKHLDFELCTVILTHVFFFPEEKYTTDQQQLQVNHDT